MAYEEGLEDAGMRGRRFGFARRERRREERTIEITCFTVIIMAFMIVVAFDLRSPIIPGAMCLTNGAVLLAGAVFQWQRRFRVNPMTWMGGFASVVAGVYGIQRPLPGDLMIPFALFAFVILGSFVSGEF